MLVDAEKGVRQPAFDHARLAEALAKAGLQDVRADRLRISEMVFHLKEREVDFRIERRVVALRSGKVRRFAELSPAERPKPSPRAKKPPEELRASVNTGAETDITFINRTKGEVELFWIDSSGKRISYGKIPAGQERRQHTYRRARLAGGRRKETELLDIVMAEEDPLEVEITGKPAFASAAGPKRRERHRAAAATRPTENGSPSSERTTSG